MLGNELASWLGQNEKQLTLFEADNPINLQRYEDHLLLSAQLTDQPPDNVMLGAWMHLGHASREHFQGALAQAPESGQLRLLQRLPDTCRKSTLPASLEALLNQRGTWRAMALQPRQTTAKPHSLPISLLSQ